MSSSPYKGGKGQVAPFVTTHCRVPEPIKPLIESIISDWKYRVHSGSQVEGDLLVQKLEQALIPDLISLIDKPLTSQEAIQIANLILQENVKSKRSVKIVVAKLLTAIYKTDIKLQ